MAVIDLSQCFPAAKDGSRAPLPKQAEFLRQVLSPEGPKFVGYYGGFGSGKSLILCITMLTQGVMFGGEYVISRHFMPELNRTTRKAFLEIIPKELLIEHRVADGEVYVKSATGKPAVFYFIGLDSPDKLDSLNLSGFAIDEASQTTEEAFLKLQGRLRNPLGLRKGIVVGNPRGHNWVFQRFVAKRQLGALDAKSKFSMIVAPSTENKHLPEGYIETMLQSYSQERIQRDIYGSWDSFEGQIYTEFDRGIHVVKPFAIPESWTRIVGADHGYTNPAAMLWGAVDHDGNVWIYKELYRTSLLVKEIAEEFRRINAGDRVDAIYIDPSTKAVRSQTGASDFDAYLDYLPKEIGLLPAKNDVTAGIDRVKTYLKLNERTQKPRLYFFETCSSLLAELPQYQWEELGPNLQGRANEKERPRKYNDHACDALRYLLMSRPDTPDDPTKRADAPWPRAETAIQAELRRIKNPPTKDPFSDA